MKQTVLYKKTSKKNNNDNNYGRLNWKIDKLLIAIEKLLRRIGS